MKKYINTMLTRVFLAWLFVLASSPKAFAVPVIDTSSTIQEIKSLGTKVRENATVVSIMITVQTGAAAIGGAQKTVSEYVLKKKQKIEEAVAKAKKYKDKVEKYKKEYEAYKAELDENIAKAKEFKKEMEDGIQEAKDGVQAAKDTVNTAKEAAGAIKDKASSTIDSVKDKVDKAADKAGLKDKKDDSQTDDNASETAAEPTAGQDEITKTEDVAGATIIEPVAPVSGRKPFETAADVTTPTAEANVLATDTAPTTEVNVPAAGTDTSAGSAISSGATETVSNSVVASPVAVAPNPIATPNQVATLPAVDSGSAVPVTASENATGAEGTSNAAASTANATLPADTSNAAPVVASGGAQTIEGELSATQPIVSASKSIKLETSQTTTKKPATKNIRALPSKTPTVIAPQQKFRRKAFKTSALHTTETLAFAKLTLPDGGTDFNGNVLIPRALAMYCGLSSADATKENAVDDCLLRINKERVGSQAYSGSDAPKVDNMAVAQSVAATIAEAFKARQDADSFIEKFVEPIEYAPEDNARDTYANIVQLNQAIDMQMNNLLKIQSSKLATKALINYGQGLYVPEED